MFVCVRVSLGPGCVSALAFVGSTMLVGVLHAQLCHLACPAQHQILKPSLGENITKLVGKGTSEIRFKLYYSLDNMGQPPWSLVSLSVSEELVGMRF